jgi:hypothetical protein
MSRARLIDQIDETIGDRIEANQRFEHLGRLADRMTAAHWHVADLPWRELPPLPIPDGVPRRRLRSFVEFGKRAIGVQLAAEHIAVSAAHSLLQYAQRRGLHPSIQRALAALLNDEASHVAVMLELQVEADRVYPEPVVGPACSPLFDAFEAAIPRLHPALVAIFMGSYEAMIAIRSYAEQAAYKVPSLLGRVAARAAHDDGHHAKVLRLVAYELFNEMQKTVPEEERARSSLVRSQIYEPTLAFWPLLSEHEYYLLGRSPRFTHEWRHRVQVDAEVMGRMFSAMGLPECDGFCAELRTISNHMQV